MVNRSVVIQPGVTPPNWYSRSPPHACMRIVRSGRLRIEMRPPPGVRRLEEVTRPSNFLTEATSNLGNCSGGRPIGGGGPGVRGDPGAPAGGGIGGGAWLVVIKTA